MGSQTRGLAGEPARTPTRPLLSHLGLASSARQLGTRLPPQPRRPAGREALAVWDQSPRGPQPRWENEPSLRPAGAFPKYRHTCFHARSKSDAYRQSGQQMTILSAERGKSGGEGGGGCGEGLGEKGAKGQW